MVGQIRSVMLELSVALCSPAWNMETSVLHGYVLTPEPICPEFAFYAQGLLSPIRNTACKNSLSAL